MDELKADSYQPSPALRRINTKVVIDIGTDQVLERESFLYDGPVAECSVSPSSNQQANLPQSTVIYNDANFRQNLKSATPFVQCTVRIPFPVRSGNTYRLFEYTPFAINTSVAPPQAAEGTVGTGLTAAVLQSTAIIGEYADYSAFSSLALATAIDNPVKNIAKEMGYKLGQVLSQIVRLVADAGTSFDSSIAVKLPATSTSVYSTLTLSVLRNAKEALVGRAVPKLEGYELFPGVMHPFAKGDVESDNSNNSPFDIMKHTPEGMKRMESFVSADQGEAMVELVGSGLGFFLTNLVTQTSNYNPGTGAVTGLTALRTYIFGEDGVFSYDLAAPGDTAIGQGNWQGIKCNVMENLPMSQADPSGLIPGITSYKSHFTASNGLDTTGRYRYIDAASAVS